MRNICPHQSASFEHGFVRSCVAGEAVRGEDGGAELVLTVDEREPIVQCPWHRWDFRLSDGICASDDRFRARVYVTRVEDGIVFADMGPARRGSPTPAGEEVRT